MAVGSINKIMRTTAFKLSAIYLIIFTIFAIFLIVYISLNTQILITRQLNSTIDAEVRGLVEQYRSSGLPGLVKVIEDRSNRPGASLYLVTDFRGHYVAGNVAALPDWVLDKRGAVEQSVPYQRLGDTSRNEYNAAVSVYEIFGGYRLLVGRDVGERELFRKVVEQAFIVSAILMIVLAMLAWFFVSRKVLKRIDVITDASHRIMRGQLDERLPVTQAGDEFDRLSESLNTMLSRIEALMQGLKEVSDNIAHDLKTPLTRLRNRVELTLSTESADMEGYRQALEQTLDESETLIRTFDALLRIARVEAKNVQIEKAPLDIGFLAADMAELYEPVAEDEGALLTWEAEPGYMILGNRELISQAVANLIDNAMKYAVRHVAAHCETSGHEGELPDQARIHVKVAEETEAAGKPPIRPSIILSISDNGPGIAKEDRARVLQRFVRLDKSRTQPGSGLGLSLVNAVASLHEARIELEDNEPGLIFSIHFPALAPEAADDAITDLADE
ncbi:Signal transduction histidine kinase [Cohaesibacter sp. ES.047]|uniref:sensor histidine kinase n=1 Tax=Cohaesibacter sp. ES.047 TaxID=1798205 RepID=UPI000BC07E1D|nr:ATP-binding protein [Cohaesibacter sp. ES.047]SNY92827.1 Signal transduction histidine kinase [Cohaesibacter sp. ES.047]